MRRRLGGQRTEPRELTTRPRDLVTERSRSLRFAAFASGRAAWHDGGCMVALDSQQAQSAFAKAQEHWRAAIDAHRTAPPDAGFSARLAALAHAALEEARVCLEADEAGFLKPRASGQARAEPGIGKSTGAVRVDRRAGLLRPRSGTMRSARGGHARHRHARLLAKPAKRRDLARSLGLNMRVQALMPVRPSTNCDAAGQAGAGVGAGVGVVRGDDRLRRARPAQRSPARLGGRRSVRQLHRGR